MSAACSRGSSCCAECDVVLLPKPTPADLAGMREGQVLCGWVHCVQDQALTQVAIDRRLTLIAWEAMNHWAHDGTFGLHVFHQNNELAGYSSVLHAMQLKGTTGEYGQRLRAAVIGFGATGRGAVLALRALGVHDVSVLTHREAAAVAAPIHSVRLMTYARGSGGTLEVDSRRETMSQFLAEHDVIVNCIFQDTEAPLIFVTNAELSQFRAGTIFVDVSADAEMGFEWARPTTFEEPIFELGGGAELLRGRPQSVAALELGNVGDQQGADAISAPAARRARSVGGRRDAPPRDRDPRRRRPEPQDPLLPGPCCGLPARPERRAMTPGEHRRLALLVAVGSEARARTRCPTDESG